AIRTRVRTPTVRLRMLAVTAPRAQIPQGTTRRSSHARVSRTVAVSFSPRPRSTAAPARSASRIRPTTARTRTRSSFRHRATTSPARRIRTALPCSKETPVTRRHSTVRTARRSIWAPTLSTRQTLRRRARLPATRPATVPFSSVRAAEADRARWVHNAPPASSRPVMPQQRRTPTRAPTRFGTEPLATTSSPWRVSIAMTLSPAALALALASKAPFFSRRHRPSRKDRSMLRLYGFSASNYYNIVKLALLEKGLAFDEVLTYTGADEHHQPEYLEKSPLGKVPCLETDEGFISESRCIIAYLEHAYPERPLFPASAFARAKLLELTQIIDLYLELAARRLLPNLFARTEPPASVANDVRQTVAKGTRGLSRLARFDGYLDRKS